MFKSTTKVEMTDLTEIDPMKWRYRDVTFKNMPNHRNETFTIRLGLFKKVVVDRYMSGATVVYNICFNSNIVAQSVFYVSLDHKKKTFKETLDGSYSYIDIPAHDLFNKIKTERNNTLKAWNESKTKSVVHKFIKKG